MVSLTEELKLVRIGFVIAYPVCILGYKLLNLGDNVKNLILNLSLKFQVIGDGARQHLRLLTLSILPAFGWIRPTT